MAKPTVAELAAKVEEMEGGIAAILAAVQAPTETAAPPAKENATPKPVKLKPLDGFLPAKDGDKVVCWVGRDTRSGRVVVAKHDATTGSPRLSKDTYTHTAKDGTQTLKQPNNRMSVVNGIPVAAEQTLAEFLISENA